MITGRELTSLMRSNRITIRELSGRMQITQKRIREVREGGLTDLYAIRDWVEAITGSDPGRLDCRWDVVAAISADGSRRILAKLTA